MYVTGTKKKPNLRGNFKTSDYPKRTQNITGTLAYVSDGNNIRKHTDNKNNRNIDQIGTKRLVRSKFTENTPTYARPTIATATRDIITAKEIKAKTDNNKKPSPVGLELLSIRKNLNVKEVISGDLTNHPKISRAKTPLHFEELDLTSEIKTSVSIETGIQSNEQEILNHELIVGDVKLLWPSQQLVSNIEQERKDQRRMELINSPRKYDANNTGHLEDLKEFMESAAITRRSSRPMPAPTAVIRQKNKMQDIEKKLKSQVSKNSSQLSLKTRIKQKEVELLSLFDNIGNFR